MNQQLSDPKEEPNCCERPDDSENPVEYVRREFTLVLLGCFLNPGQCSFDPVRLPVVVLSDYLYSGLHYVSQHIYLLLYGY